MKLKVRGSLRYIIKGSCIVWGLICLLRHLNVFTVSLQNFPSPPHRCSSPGRPAAWGWPVPHELVQANLWLLVSLSGHCNGAGNQGHITKQVPSCFTAVFHFLCHLRPVDCLLDEYMLSSFMPAVNSHTNEHLEAEKSSRRLERDLRAIRKRLGTTLVLRANLEE